MEDPGADRHKGKTDQEKNMVCFYGDRLHIIPKIAQESVKNLEYTNSSGKIN
jgi:hypothetical protein